MTLTYVDSGVLIAAARRADAVGAAALLILSDADRSFASSEFVRLEVLPKALYHRQQEEVEFYETFFTAFTQWAIPLDRVIDGARRSPPLRACSDRRAPGFCRAPHRCC